MLSQIRAMWRQYREHRACQSDSLDRESKAREYLECLCMGNIVTQMDMVPDQVRVIIVDMVLSLLPKWPREAHDHCVRTLRYYDEIMGILVAACWGAQWTDDEGMYVYDLNGLAREVGYILAHHEMPPSPALLRVEMRE